MAFFVVRGTCANLINAHVSNNLPRRSRTRTTTSCDIIISCQQRREGTTAHTHNHQRTVEGPTVVTCLVVAVHRALHLGPARLCRTDKAHTSRVLDAWSAIRACLRDCERPIARLVACYATFREPQYFERVCESSKGFCSMRIYYTDLCWRFFKYIFKYYKTVILRDHRHAPFIGFSMQKCAFAHGIICVQRSRTVNCNIMIMNDRRAHASKHRAQSKDELAMQDTTFPLCCGTMCFLHHLINLLCAGL